MQRGTCAAGASRSRDVETYLSLYAAMREEWWCVGHLPNGQARQQAGCLALCTSRGRLPVLCSRFSCLLT